MTTRQRGIVRGAGLSTRDPNYAASMGIAPARAGTASPSIRRRFIDGKRRLFESVKGVVMSNRVVEVPGWQENWEAYLELQENVINLISTMEAHLDSIRDFYNTFPPLLDAFERMGLDDEVLRDVHSAQQIVRKETETKLSGALQSLGRKALIFDHIAQSMQMRETHKLDLGAYRAKVHSMRKSNDEKLYRTETKLLSTAQALFDVSQDIMRQFGYYQAVGGRLCEPEYQIFKQAVKDMYSTTHETAHQLEVQDPINVEAEVERLGHGATTNIEMPDRPGSVEEALTFMWEPRGRKARAAAAAATAEGATTPTSSGGRKTAGGDTSPGKASEAPQRPPPPGTNSGPGRGAPEGSDEEPLFVGSALWAFSGDPANDELEFAAQAKIRVMEEDESGWCWGEVVDDSGAVVAAGMFPRNYVKGPGDS